METVRSIQKTLCSRAMLAAVAGAVILILVGQKAVAKGLVLGTLFSVVNFVLMGLLLPVSVTPSRARASAAAMGSIVIRFLLLAVPLVIAIRMESIHFVGVVIGIFMVQLTMLFDALIMKRFSSVKDIG